MGIGAGSGGGTSTSPLDGWAVLMDDMLARQELVWTDANSADLSRMVSIAALKPDFEARWRIGVGSG